MIRLSIKSYVKSQQELVIVETKIEYLKISDKIVKITVDIFEISDNI